MATKNRYVNTKYWRDGYIETLDPSEKLVFLYFLTAPDSNISGVYEIPLKIVSLDTGFNIETIRTILARFEIDNKMMYRDGWIAIRNFIKHQSSKSVKVQEGIKKCLELAPKELIEYIGYKSA